MRLLANAVAVRRPGRIGWSHAFWGERMGPATLLIANRGEVAIRIARTAADLGMRTVAIYSEDDAHSLHVQRADAAIALRGKGPRAYLDAPQIIALAREAGCDSIHPGYGFLSESEAFAGACREAGLVFVGPGVEVLALFGDKTRARLLAQSLHVPVLRGTFGAASLDEMRRFLDSLGTDAQVVIKASAGGGGRGMRVVSHRDELADAFVRC